MNLSVSYSAAIVTFVLVPYLSMFAKACSISVNIILTTSALVPLTEIVLCWQ